MTAFARYEQQNQWGNLCWELRSVNHRYLDISVRLPEDFRGLEATIREHIQQHLRRGKVDCTLYFQMSTTQVAPLNINLPLVQQLWTAIQTIDQLTGNSTPPSALEILRWQGVIDSQHADLEILGKEILQLFDKALAHLVTQREREGAQLANLLVQRCDAIAVEIDRVRADLPLILNGLRTKLHSRLVEVAELNPERLEQEMVLFAQKMDVAEELDRADTHLEEIRQVLGKDEAVGRRLEFLVQELHREANTLSSKANHINTTRSAVELKVLIEQIREQTQNIE
ncbi:MAG: YicC/YloC family endoribonuclease [Thiotrichaceae bacterium]